MSDKALPDDDRFEPKDCLRCHETMALPDDLHESSDYCHDCVYDVVDELKAEIAQLKGEAELRHGLSESPADAPLALRAISVLRVIEFGEAYGRKGARGFQRACPLCHNEIPESQADACPEDTHAERHVHGCELAAVLDEVTARLRAHRGSR